MRSSAASPMPCATRRSRMVWCRSRASTPPAIPDRARLGFRSPVGTSASRGLFLTSPGGERVAREVFRCVVGAHDVVLDAHATKLAEVPDAHPVQVARVGLPAELG